MSSNWKMGIVKKGILLNEEIDDFVKLLFEISDSVGFTPYWSIFTHKSGNEKNDIEIKKRYSEKEFSELIKKYFCIEGSISFAIQIAKPEVFDGFVYIKTSRYFTDISLDFRHTVASRKNQLNKIIEASEKLYRRINAFYAYVTWESGPIMAKGLENYGEFKKIYSEYKKTDKSSFNIKNFRKTVERHFGIKLD